MRSFFFLFLETKKKESGLNCISTPSVLMISSVLRAQPRLKAVIFCCDPRPHHHTSPLFHHQPRSFTWYLLHTPPLYHTTAFWPFHSPLRPSSTLLCFTVFSTTSQDLASFQI
ncbi:hypothetical protein BDR06DRAFT_444266 [Suillus hirtellus]|nr:hypothetical protein BDR06DRAFT_444266 [Suillus hirtellus]